MKFDRKINLGDNNLNNKNVNKAIYPLGYMT